MKTSFFLIAACFIHFYCFSQINPEWTTVFNNSYGASCIKADIYGNFYVGGSGIPPNTNNAQDYLLIKYNSSGMQKWVQYYNGARNFDDFTVAIAIDSLGNIYVTGGSDEDQTGMDITTIKYNTDGQMLWKSYYRGNGYDNDDIASAIALDRFGNIFVTGESRDEYITIKYNSDGDTVWTRRYGGGELAKPTALAVDFDGNVYVTGYRSFGVGERYNYVTIKYTPTGDTSWIGYYNGTASDDDVATGLVVDNNKNVYVTGISWGLWYDDYATVKYDSLGNQQWVARYNGPVNSYDKAYDIKLDKAGSIYVTGASGGIGINYDFTTIKYNPSGQQLWVKRYNGPDNYNDYARAMIIDEFANIYVTGYSENAPAPYSSSTDYLTVMYDSTGTEQWTHRYNGQGNYDDEARAITIDNLGNVAITGTCRYYGAILSDIATIKFSKPNAIIDLNNFQKANIYPNPVSEKLFFQATKRFESVNVYDIFGRLVLAERLLNNALNLYSVDVSNLQNGIYFIELKGNKELYTSKFIKY